MCLILAARAAHPRYRLVLAANRDELFARDSAALAWWPDRPAILGGRDLAGGGTWLAASRNGRIAALTNFRDPQHRHDEAPSRGALVTDFLLGHDGVAEHCIALQQRHHRYNGFNLLLWDGQALAVFESPSGTHRLLPPGIYGLSNAQLDTPWPKVVAGRDRLRSALDTLPDATAILALLRNDRPAPDPALPDTGVGLAWERLLSSAFVRAPGYGTRCSTLCLVDGDGTISLREWSWHPDGSPAGSRAETFTPD